MRYIKAAGRFEGGHRAGLEAETRVAAASRLIHNVPQHQFADTLPAERRSGPHRFDLAVIGAKLLQRSTAHKPAAVPDAPKSDLRPAQAIEVECMHALRRRLLMHLAKMIRKQLRHLLAGKIVGFDRESRHEQVFTG